MLSLLGALSMLVQILLVKQMGYDLIQTALPLHLCGMMGLLTAPMLFTKARLLRAFYVYLGLPSAMLALVFPAMMPCPHMGLMTLAFSTLHCVIVLSALLACYRPPPLRPLEAAYAWGMGMLFMGAVWLINHAINTNYLFLRAAPAQTPLEALFKLGQAGYLLSLMGIAAALLMGEAFLVWLINRPKPRYLRPN